jgi:uncharacterized protein (TIGR04255 family)
LAFPEAERVIYAKNPLDRVICQLRFPPILRIDADIPAGFQERIRNRFPNFGEKAEWNIQLPGSPEAQIPAEVLQQIVKSNATKNYEFQTDERDWTVNLTRTFLALTTTAYTRWELFKDVLELPFRALIEEYAPDQLSRVGLRYVDVIRRSDLGLDGVQWSELLQPHILALLASPQVGSSVEAFESKYQIMLPEREGLVKITAALVDQQETHESAFLIDSDFFRTGRTPVGDAVDLLDYFNARASRLIRWAITDRLHNAMEPTPI